jgi:hypothetical protein
MLRMRGGAPVASRGRPFRPGGVHQHLILPRRPSDRAAGQAPS